MPIVIATVVILSVMYVMGYRYRPETNEIERGGLVKFISNPYGANIDIDGQRLSYTTNTRYDASAGDHKVVISKDGYRSWSKDFKLKSGEVLWLSYIWLLPDDIKQNIIKTYNKVDSVAVSRSEDIIMIIEDSKKPVITRVDASYEKNETAIIKIPSKLYPAKKLKDARFKIRAIDSAGRRALVSVSSAGQEKILMIDTERPDQSMDISKIVKAKVSYVEFLKNNSRYIYVVANGNLQKIDTYNKTVSNKLVKNVNKIHQTNSGLFSYVKKTNKSNSETDIGFYNDYTLEDTKVKSVKKDAKKLDFYLFKYGHFNYAVINDSSKIGVYDVALDDVRDVESAFQRIDSIDACGESTHILPSPAERFFAIGCGSYINTYDLELKELSSKVNSLGDKYKFNWLDDNHLWINSKGDTYVCDFDLNNMQLIDSKIQSKGLLLSNNGEFLYSFANSKKGVAFQRAKLVVEK